MMLEKIVVYKVLLPLHKPMVTGFGSVTEREIVLISCYDEDGNVGYGECPTLSDPLYTNECTVTAYEIVKEYFGPLLLKNQYTTAGEANDFLNTFKGHYFAKSGLIMALLDLEAKKNKISLFSTYGKSLKVKKCGTISVHHHLDDCMNEVDTYVEKGYSFLKLKTKPNYDILQVEAIRNKYPNIALFIDANSSYSYNEESIELYKKIDAYGLVAIEQPFCGPDLLGHSMLQKSIKTPIALDESIESFFDLSQALKLNSCKYVNIKMPRVGGFLNAIQMNKVCSQHNIPCWVGGMLESPFGFMANLLLATVENFSLPIDFTGGLSYIKDFTSYFHALPYNDLGSEMEINILGNGFGFDCIDIKQILDKKILCAEITAQ